MLLLHSIHSASSIGSDTIQETLLKHMRSWNGKHSLPISMRTPALWNFPSPFGNQRHSVAGQRAITRFIRTMLTVMRNASLASALGCMIRPKCMYWFWGMERRGTGSWFLFVQSQETSLGPWQTYGELCSVLAVLLWQAKKGYMGNLPQSIRKWRSHLPLSARAVAFPLEARARLLYLGWIRICSWYNERRSTRIRKAWGWREDFISNRRAPFSDQDL